MDFRAIIMGLAFALIWSSAFTSARVIVQDASPLAALTMRFLVSGIVGVLIARALGQSWHMTRDQWRAIFIFGLCQNALYLGLNFVAMQWVEASFASIIASTMPLLVALSGIVFLGDRLPRMALLGLVLGILGVIVIMWHRLEGGIDPRGAALCLLAAAAITIATLSMRRASSGGNVMMVVGLQMFVGAGILAVVALIFEPIHVTPTPRLAIAFIYTTLIPGVLATWVWFKLVERIGAVRAASFHFLNPFFGVAIAAIVLGENLGMMDLIGVSVITVGIFLVQRAKQSHTRS